VKKTARFVIWICSKFTRQEIEQIIQGLFDVLANRNPEVKPKDDFKEKHPHYRRFLVDPIPPLKVPPEKKPKLNWKELLSDYQEERGCPLVPVKIKSSETRVPHGVICGVCSAPAKYLYFNDGKKRTQLKCKVCSSLSQVHPGHLSKAKYFCPHCQGALYLWKERREVGWTPLVEQYFGVLMYRLSDWLLL